MKNYILTYILLALGFITSCSDTDSNTLPGGVTDNLKEGFTYLPETPDADQPLTITFKASPTSALYGYAGDVYLHTGIVSEGVWLYVPADWNENIEKCKFTKSQTEANVWTITLSPSIREWFASGTTPVEQLGIIIRSADGSKKGIDKDQFVNVTDMKYHGFVPGKVQEKSLPSGYAGYYSTSMFPPVELLYVTGTEKDAVASALQNMWSTTLGVNVMLRGVTQAEYNTRMEAGNYELALQKVTALYDDAMGFLDRWCSEDEQNLISYENGTYDVLMGVARASEDPVARTAFLHDAETMLLGETALSPVYFDGTAHMLRDTLRGVYTDGFGNSYFAGVRANTD